MSPWLGGPEATIYTLLLGCMCFLMTPLTTLCEEDIDWPKLSEQKKQYSI